MKYKIVTDSSSNLFSMEDVDYTSVPLKILTDKKEFVDGPALNISGMLEHLKNTRGPSSTSCPNFNDWLQAFDGADAVFAITITSKLSGSCSSAMQAAREFPGKAYVIDSLSTGPEMELIVEFLRDRINEGMEFEAICQAVDAYRQKTHLVFSLESLHNLAKNGRVSHAVACLAGVLGIRLVGKASDDGVLEPLHKCRGESRTYETLFETIMRMGYKGGKLRIATCLNSRGAAILAGKVRDLYPDADLDIRGTGALCSYYAEVGGMMVGFEA